ncbi:MAG: DUF3048 domain-containing protein [Clostridiales bacterium]|nr:DUF3048 domain-containing protein [Clostridiales bacterium]
MKKKTLLLFLSAVLVCSALTGCGGKEEEAAAPAVTDISEGDTTEEDEASEEPEEIVEEETREGMYRSELTNEWIDESLQNQRPVAIMVDNEKTALLHYGMTQADIVYELMNSTANGEITRFMAIVKDWGNITQFGSIRSVRPTNFMIAPEYNAVVVHDGGPFYIDAYLKNPWVEHFSGGFSRVNNGKPREFTEYVMSGDLESRFESSGYSTEYNEYYQGPHWQFASETNPVDLAEASDSMDCTLVDLPFDHNGSELKYDEASNTYLYSEYNMKHTDPANGDKQLAFTNVLIQNATHTKYDENGYMQFNILNTKDREGYYITGGKAIPVTWSKGHDMDPTKFYDKDGNEITLNTGKTYIALVSDTRWDELVLE